MRASERGHDITRIARRRRGIHTRGLIFMRPWRIVDILLAALLLAELFYPRFFFFFFLLDAAAGTAARVL